MSKRKQRKPLQRKTIEASEGDGDTLTCGECHTEFTLSNISKFIQHKVRRCDKENIQPVDDHGHSHDSEGEDEDSDAKDAIPLINSRRTSISAPILGRRGTPELRISPHQINSSLEMTDSMEDHDENTNILEETEPLNFGCCSCKVVCVSAWGLLRHVQKAHNMKIYIEICQTGLSTVKRAGPIITTSTTSPIQNDSQMVEDSSKDEVCSNGDYDLDMEDTEIEEESKCDKSLAEKSSPDPEGAHVTGRTNQMTPKDLHSPPNPFMSSFRNPLSERQHHRSSSPVNRPSYIMGDQFHRLPPGMPIQPQLGGLGLDPPHSAFPNPFDRTRPPFFASIADFDLYSKRLRELARVQAVPTSIGGSQKPSQSAFSSSTSSSPSAFSPSQQAQTADMGKRTPPEGCLPKLKACEFCGKCFRFQSNLIVHRRSHTGDKPFKCPLCPHACTQASKLKRHMKTHQNKPSGAWTSANQSSDSPGGDRRSTSSSPDSNQASIIERHLLELEEENEIEEESDLEEDEEDEEGEDGMNLSEEQEKPRRRPTRDQAADNEPGNGCESIKPKSIASPDGDNMYRAVVGNSGLLQHYHDAFTQALAESDAHKGAGNNGGQHPNPRKGVKDQESLKRGSNRETNVNEHTDTKMRRSLSNQESNLDKRIKSEVVEGNTPPANNMESYYSHPFWYPQYAATCTPRELMAMMPYGAPSSNGVNGPGISGPYPTNNRSRMMSTNSTTPSGPLVGMHNMQHKRERRSDTCEFCGKVFKNCSNLTVHRRSHTGEKPYKCELCSYACAQSSKLTRHMRTHGRIGKDSYYCKFCNTPFSVPSTLEKHMRKCVESQQGRVLHQHPALTDICHMRISANNTNMAAPNSC